MKLGMPVILVQVRRLNDPPQHGFLQIKGPFISYARGVGWQEWGVEHVKFRTVRGGSSINLHTKRGVTIFLFCFIFKQILSVLSGLTVHCLI